MEWNIRRVLITIIDLVLATITLVIGLRVILEFFGANSGAALVSAIYKISDNLIYPFSGIFPNLNLQGAALFDLTSIIAMTIYVILGYILISIINTVTNALIRHRHYHQERRHLI